MAQTPLHFPARPTSILIVAPSSPFRDSLSFLLEEESYRVTTADSLAEADRIEGKFACTVLDHHVLRGNDGVDTSDFLTSHWPVVMLTNGPESAGADAGFRVLTKPFLGPALSHAVRDAVAVGAGYA